jgi:hypothetical protein
MNTPKTRTPSRHKPAEPKLTNEQERQRKARFAILKDSELNRALWRVKEAAEELEALIEEAEDAHMHDMTEVTIAQLGLKPAMDDRLSSWSDEVYRDLIGFRWGLTQFKDLLRTLGQRPEDLDEVEAATPAIVTT